MSILTFAAHGLGKTPPLRIAAAAFVLLCSLADRAQAADFTVGGSISNLLGSGLVLRLDAQAACIPSGGISAVTNSSAAGGTLQCQTTATSQCCTLSSFNFQSTVNGDGTINCTVTCGTIVANVPTSQVITPQAGPTSTQTVAPAANAVSYTFGTSLSDGSTFTASIDTQPSSPAQVCT